MMILHNSSDGSIKFSSLCQLQHQNCPTSANVPDSQCLPTPMLLLYSPRTPGQCLQCPQCLMSVEMVVRRRRRRDTRHWDQIPPPPLPELTPGLSQGTTKDSPVPRPLAASLTSLRIHSMVSRPGPAHSQHSVRASLRLIPVAVHPVSPDNRTLERFSARIFPVLARHSSSDLVIIRNLTTARRQIKTADSAANTKLRLLLARNFYLCFPDAAQFLPRPMVRRWIYRSWRARTGPRHHRVGPR